MRKALPHFCFIMLSVASTCHAQVPTINNLSVKNTYPLGTLVITGSGFSTNSALLEVWFDQVKGTIIASSDLSIEVRIPAQARLANIEVINLSSKLSARSALKFMPSFYGDTFDPEKFTSPLAFTSPEELWDICSCDLNNDQKPDLLSTKFFSPGNDLVILQNQSTLGSLAFNKLSRTMSFPTDHISCGDLDGDGKPDVVVARSGSPRNSVHILKNTSSGGVIDLSSTPINLFLDNGHFATRTYLSDLNKDGKPEIVVSNSFNNLLYVFVNESIAGTIAFNASPIKIAVTGAINTYGLDVQDIDGDKLPDIIVTQFQSSNIFILRNQSAGTIQFSEPYRITVSGNLNKLITADFNNDDRLDIATTSTLTNQVFIILNQSTPGTFAFGTPTVITTSNGPWGIDVSDIDGDLDPDIIIANRNQTVLDIFLHNGNFSSPGFIVSNVATVKPSRNVLAGDLDGDGKPDLAFTSFNTGTNSYSLDILRNTNCHKPKFLNEAPLSVCSGQTIRLKAVPALNVTFTWKEGVNTLKTGPDAFLDVTAAGSYTVTTTGDGCSLTSSPFTISSSAATAPAEPVITANTPLCTGANLQLSTTLVTGAVYIWKGPNAFTSSLRTPVINSVTEANAGVYTLEVAVGNCRSNVVAKTIEVASLDDFSMSSTSATNAICSGGNVTLSVGNLGGYTFQWKKNGSDIPGQTNNTLLVTEENTYAIKVSNTSLGCSKDIGPVSVMILSAPTAAFNMPATACTNSAVTFTNQSTGVDTRATVVYAWNFGGGKTFAGATPPTQSYALANTYNISLSISYAGIAGCTAVAPGKSIAITNAAAPSISAVPSTICPGESATISVAGTFNAINWAHGASGNSITVTQPGAYTATATDPAGCIFIKDFTLQSKPVPQIDISADKTSITPGEAVQLKAIGANTFEWTPSEFLDHANIADPISTPKTSITYTVIGFLTGGCSAQKQISIAVDASKLNIKPPLAFSPNNDNYNDTWIIDEVDQVAGCTLSIFDGRGKRVFQKKGYTNDWDGTYDGRPVPAGTYYYVFGCPDNRSASGSVLVFR